MTITRHTPSYRQLGAETDPFLSTIHEGDAVPDPDTEAPQPHEYALAGVAERIPRGKWPAEVRAEAVALAMSVGHSQAAVRLGIPRRTISKWVSSSEMQGLVLESRDKLADRFGQAVTLALDAVLEGLKDPKARLGDRARALEVLSQQHALLTGDVTARTESTTFAQIADETLSREDVILLRDGIQHELDLRGAGPLSEEEVAELRAYLETGRTDVG